jgi:hypothetical protein
MLGRRYSRRRPTLRDGITPRLARSSTVERGTCSRSATSRAVNTSAAVSGRPSGCSIGADARYVRAEVTGKLICLGLSFLDMGQN